MRFIVASLLGLFCAVAAAGEVYKWVDQQGNVHYGDRPKRGGEAVEVRGSGTASGQPTPEAQEVAARDAECQRRRQLLENYRKAPTIKETDGLGRSREYSPQEREQFIALQEKQITEACAPAPVTAAP